MTNLLRVQREDKEEKTELKSKLDNASRQIKTMSNKLKENANKIELLQAANNHVTKENHILLSLALSVYQ